MIPKNPLLPVFSIFYLLSFHTVAAWLKKRPERQNERYILAKSHSCPCGDSGRNSTSTR